MACCLRNVPRGRRRVEMKAPIHSYKDSDGANGNFPAPATLGWRAQHQLQTALKPRDSSLKAWGQGTPSSKAEERSKESGPYHIPVLSLLRMKVPGDLGSISQEGGDMLLPIPYCVKNAHCWHFGKERRDRKNNFIN